MALDTKWIKFKYSNFNKFLCVFIACCFAGVFVINGLSVLKYLEFFSIETIAEEVRPGIYDSYQFKNNLNEDMQIVIDDVSHNENQAAYDNAKQQTAERAVEVFNILKERNRIQNEVQNREGTTDFDISYYHNYEDEDYVSEEITEVTTLVADNSFKLDSDVSYYNLYDSRCEFTIDVAGDSENNHTVTFDANYSLSDEEALESFKGAFGNQEYSYYCHDTAEAGESADRLNLKNVWYYAEYPDGSVATNVNNPDVFLRDAKNGDYLILDSGELFTSDSLADVSIYNNYYGDTYSKVKLTIAFDKNFSGDDYYHWLFSNVESVRYSNVESNLICCIISVIAMLLFFVISIRLAGHRGNEISTALIDKTPTDLHFILTVLADVGVAALIALMLTVQDELLYRQYYGGKLAEYLLNSNYWMMASLAVGALFYLVILEFGTSVARSVKAGKNIFKNTIIFGMCTLIFRFFKWVFSGMKAMHKRNKKFLSTILFKPERLDKKAVAAVLLFALFNIFSTCIIILFFSIADGFAVFCALLGIIAVIAADAFCVYKAFKYMGLLDMIIDKSGKNEPIEVDLNTLPESLQVLAAALDEKNAELQNAVIKAVKDERTKTELITNVSHDLKTPLTSVINYIDLLQKCDIEDETAKKYMTVIAEKSNKLKRLIEDLIEASKVSTGNVTINKTKLNLNELAAQAIVEETADIEKRGLQIIFDEAVEKNIVFADGTKVYRVFENLLSNARKYSAAGSRIYARVYSDSNYGYFELKNISKDALNISAEELTERFVRGDRSRTEDGNGLGLSIAKEICLLNGGELIISIDGDLFKATVKLPKNDLGSDDE